MENYEVSDFIEICEEMVEVLNERLFEELAEPEKDAADEAFEAWLDSLEPEGGPPKGGPSSSSSPAPLRLASPAIASAFLSALLLLPGCSQPSAMAAIAPNTRQDLRGEMDRDWPKKLSNWPKHVKVHKVELPCQGLTRLQCAAADDYNRCIQSAAGCTDQQLNRDNLILLHSGEAP